MRKGKVEKRYKQIVGRPSQKINFTLSTGFLLLTIFISCGPRSGIHNENTDNSEDDKIIKGCGNATLSGHALNGHKIFKMNCAVCHSSHTDEILTGPGLKGVFDRVPSEEWFISYSLNCDSVTKSGDKYAKKLRKKFKDIRMTNFSGHLTKTEAIEIVAFLKSPS